MKNKTSPAFTIVELLIVIVIIGILAAITIVAYNGIQDRAKTTTVKEDLHGAATVLGVDQALSGAYPPDLASANGGQGVKTTAGTTLSYSVNNTSSDPGFCLTAMNGDVVYHTTQNGSPEPGACGNTVTLTCPSGFVQVPGNSLFGTSDFCVMKYEAKNVGGVAVSQNSGTPWTNISGNDAKSVSNGVCSGCHLINEAEWLTIAHNIIRVPSNWHNGNVGGDYIYRGHSDEDPGNPLAASATDSDGYYGTNSSGNQQRRTLSLSNGGVIWDFAGNVWEWTSTSLTGAQPGPSGQGWAWREWRDVPSPGTMNPNPLPKFGTSAAADWTSAEGLGLVFSSPQNTGSYAAVRGGDWRAYGVSGIFGLELDFIASTGYATVGFRVAAPGLPQT